MYEPIREIQVCAACWGDATLAAWVAANGEQGACERCERDSAVVSVRALGSYLRERIREHYGLALEELLFDNESESGFAGKTFTSGEVFEREGLELEDDALRRALERAVGDDLWCKDPACLPPHVSLRASWDAFVERIQTGRRFFLPTETPGELARGDVNHPDRPLTVMELMVEALTRAEDVRLFRPLPAGTTLFRARTFAAGGHIPSSEAELGPPPAARAPANRMSPAGIPMFYAALDLETARVEAPPEPGRGQVVAEFRSRRDLLVLDLTDVPVPGIFDPQLGAAHESCLFLKHLSRRISAPISRDGREHIDYVPTQAFAEFLRFVHRRPDGVPVDGLLFSSSRRPGGVCLALFATQADLASAGGHLALARLINPR
ncbi:MAG: HEPN-associated N-terminal domain-containing protein [Myxococcota bacterium]